MNPPTDAVTWLHVDEALIVACKPAGLLAVPGRGEAKQDCLAARVQAVHPDALVVHRLDEATSGLMVFARGPAVQRALSAAFEARQVHKRYLAVVAGHVAADHGTIDLPLASDWPNRPRQQVDAVRGRPSLTRYEVLGRSTTEIAAAAGELGCDPVDVASGHALQTAQAVQTSQAMRRVHADNQALATQGARGHALAITRLQLEPVTGRSHQLRVHLLALGHPILGDRLYAPSPLAAAASRMLLHASELGLRHPRTGQALAWRAPAPF